MYVTFHEELKKDEIFLFQNFLARETVAADNPIYNDSF